MCILALAIDASPRWSLVVLANRDEAHARASAPLHRWDDGSGIVAGRDLVSGGAWLGVSPRGFCAVSNVRGYSPPDPAAPSRGLLVSGVLTGADPQPQDLVPYSAVNLVAVSAGGGANFRTNRPAPRLQPLSAGLYGLSNGDLEEPSPKVLELKAGLASWLAAPADSEALMAVLRSEAAAAPDGSSHDGVFVRQPLYGTRCSTVVLVDVDGRGVIHERRYTPQGEVGGDTRLAFDWRTRA